MGYKPQYNNGNYQRKSYDNNSGSNGGTAEMISSKKDGVILKVILNNQNLVLKGFFDNRTKGWKLFNFVNPSVYTFFPNVKYCDFRNLFCHILPN